MWGKKSLNVSNVKLLSKKNQQFWLLYAFLVRMIACTLHIKLFPWHQEPKWPQWTLTTSVTSTASFHQKRWVVEFYYLKKAPKSQNKSKFI